MTELSPYPNETLPAFLARRARGASDLRLALDLGLGLVVAWGMAFARLPGWPVIASAAACFAAYGGWGIADRELRERAGDVGAGVARALRAARAVSAGAGALAAGALVLSLLALTVRNWIS